MAAPWHERLLLRQNLTALVANELIAEADDGLQGGDAKAAGGQRRVPAQITARIRRSVRQRLLGAGGGDLSRSGRSVARRPAPP
jgi:hypothetical protein